MPDTARRRDRIEELIAVNVALEERMAGWQDELPPDAGEVREVRRQYFEWYTAALREIQDDAGRVRFVDMYEGGTFTPDFKSF